MKVFVSTDMEGTAGVVDWEQCVGDGPEAAAGRKLLLGEVNAAIEGAMAGGATEIVVNDSHYLMRNLPPDELAGGASYISGSHKPLYMVQGLSGAFAAGGMAAATRWRWFRTTAASERPPGSRTPTARAWSLRRG